MVVGVGCPGADDARPPTLEGLHKAMCWLAESHQASLAQIDQMRSTQHAMLVEVRAATAGVTELREEQRALASRLEAQAHGQQGGSTRPEGTAAAAALDSASLDAEFARLLDTKLNETASRADLLEVARVAVEELVAHRGRGGRRHIAPPPAAPAWPRAA